MERSSWCPTEGQENAGKNFKVLIIQFSSQKITFARSSIESVYKYLHVTGSILFISTAYLKKRDELCDTFKTFTNRKQNTVKTVETSCEGL